MRKSWISHTLKSLRENQKATACLFRPVNASFAVQIGPQKTRIWDKSGKMSLFRENLIPIVKRHNMTRARFCRATG
jgi:hypothetical protein